MPRSPRPQFHVGYRSSRSSSKSRRRSKTPWIVSSVALATLLVGGAVAAWMATAGDNTPSEAFVPTALKAPTLAPQSGVFSVDDVLGRDAGARAESDLKQFVLEGR